MKTNYNTTLISLDEQIEHLIDDRKGLVYDYDLSSNNRSSTNKKPK